MKPIKIHYVYKITNLKPTDKRLYYIGVRSTTKSSPELDTNYNSSSKYLKEAIKEIGHTNFKKEILSIWETRKLANQEEIRLHEKYDVAKNQEYYNKSKACSSKFCTEGYVTVYDRLLDEFKNVTKEEFDNSNYYLATTKGQVTVLDIRNGIIKNVTKKDFKSKNFYQSISKNTLPIVDKRDGLIKRVSLDDYKKYDYYESIMKGTLTVRDTRDGVNKRVTVSDYDKYEYYESNLKDTLTAFDTSINKTIRVTIEEYNNNEDLINLNSQTILIYNDKDEIVYTVKNAFTKFCKENGLPNRSFEMSHQANGKKLYQTVTNPNNPKFKFKGWYAIKESLV